ncbi:MAG: ferritin-like domain-containing protein [Phycisphaerae bacterium]
MADYEITETLSRLYQAEFRCPTARLDQAMPYIGWRDTVDEFALRDIAGEDREHLAWLTDLLFEFGGAAPPASFAMDSADTHYVRLDTLLPRLIKAEQELIGAYREAAARLSDAPDAARMVARIAERHGRHLARFQELESRATSQA